MSFLIVMVLLLVVMYVVMIRPQRQRQQEQARMVESSGVGDDILTTGGIYGTIVRAEGDDLVVEIAENLEVHMTRRAVAAVLPPEDEAGATGEDAETTRQQALEEAEAELDEAAVSAEVDAVTSESAPSERR